MLGEECVGDADEAAAAVEDGAAAAAVGCGRAVLEAADGAGGGAGDGDCLSPGLGIRAAHKLHLLVDLGAADEGEHLAGGNVELVVGEPEGPDGVSDAKGGGGANGKWSELGGVARRPAEAKNGEVEGLGEGDGSGEVGARLLPHPDGDPDVPDDVEQECQGVPLCVGEVESSVPDAAENDVRVGDEIAAGIDEEAGAGAADAEATRDFGLIGSPRLARRELGGEVGAEGGGVHGALDADDSGAEGRVNGAGGGDFGGRRSGPQEEGQEKEMECPEQSHWEGNSPLGGMPPWRHGLRGGRPVSGPLMSSLVIGFQEPLGGGHEVVYLEGLGEIEVGADSPSLEHVLV